MLAGQTEHHLRHYTSVGLSALYNIEAALEAAGRTYNDLHSVLDLPSGYGRVLRWLVARVDPARVTACDIDETAVAFCASEFGVEPLLSRDDPKKIQFQRSYDLIWVGSLLTHLRPDRGLELLDVLVEQLEPGGVLVFSTEGRASLHYLDWSTRGDFLAGLTQHGFHFMPLPAGGEYGATFHTPAYITSTIEARYRGELKLVRAAERAWDSHQDVWGYQRGGDTAPAVSPGPGATRALGQAELRQKLDQALQDLDQYRTMAEEYRRLEQELRSQIAFMRATRAWRLGERYVHTRDRLKRRLRGAH